MEKKNILWILLDLIFLVIFNVIFFLFGGADGNAAVWISYGFIHLAYILLLITPFLIRKGKSAAVFGFSLYVIGSGYFLLEFVTGVIFILISPEDFKAALVVQLCIAGLYAIMLVANMIANEYTAEAEEGRQQQINYVKNASAKLKKLSESIKDKEAKKSVEKVYNAVYASPVKSHPDLAQMESRILQSVYELVEAAPDGDKESIISLAETLMNAVNERNMRLKTLN